MGEDGIVIGTDIDTSGFKEGTEQMKNALQSFLASVKSDLGRVAGSVNAMFKKIGTNIQRFQGGFSKVTAFASRAGGVFRSITGTVAGGMKKAFDGVVASGTKVVQTLGNFARNGFKAFGKSAQSASKAAGDSIKGLIRTVARLAPMIIGVRSAFGILQRGANSFLSQNKQLQNQLNACWTAIGNVIGPVITMLVNMLSQLISYLITFLHLIGLSTMTASQAAKKTQAAGAAMQKSLMGFDELNKLSDNSGGGGNGSLVDPEMPATLQKLGDALKLLMEDLKKTWKEAWDENGRGEKMMQSLKTLMSDIVDLAAEFVLAFDRAWMNADNGKKIFADIMEIVTHVANALDQMVVAARDWVMNTNWINVLVEDVRKILDEVNEITRVVDEELAPILSGKIGKFLDTVSQGIHTVLEDVQQITEGIRKMLESPQGKAMVDSLGELIISMSKFHWAFLDLILGTIEKIDWESLSRVITNVSNAVGGMVEALSGLFNNQKVQTGLALIIDIGASTIGYGITAVATAIETITNNINNADWDGINEFLTNIKGDIEIGIEKILPVFSGEPVSQDQVDSALMTAIAAALGIGVGVLSGSPLLGTLTGTIATAIVLSMTGADIEDGGGRIKDLKEKVERWLPIIFAGVGFLKGGLTGGVIGFTLGSVATLAIESVETDESGSISFDGQGFLDGLMGKLIPGGAILGGLLGLKLSGGHFVGFLIGAALSVAIMSAVEVDEAGSVKIDPARMAGEILGAVGFGAIGAIVGSVAGPVGTVVGLTIGLSVGLFIANVDLVDGGSSTWYNVAAGKGGGQTLKNKMQALIDEFGNDNVYQMALQLEADPDINFDRENITMSAILQLKRALEESAKEANFSEVGTQIGEDFKTALERDTKLSSAQIGSLMDDYREVFNSLGEDGADAFAEGILSGDFHGTAREFVDGVTNGIYSADKKPLENAAKESMATPMTEAIAEKIEERTSVEEIGASVGSALVQAGAVSYEDANMLGTNLVSGFIDGIASKIEGTGGLVETVADAISKSLQSGDEVLVTWYTSTLTSNLSEIVTMVLGALQEISDSVIWGASEMQSTAVSIFDSLASDTASIFNSLAGEAGRWGWDMMSNLASGIWSGYGMVRSAVNSVANLIASYIGFSEPDVGPLSNFHTFMPDMMKEMAYGINSNMGYPEAAIENVAGMLAGNMNLGMPAFAMGSVVPYSVGGSSRSTQEDQMMQFADLMQQSMFQAFTAALQNQSKEQNGWNVYLDGKQISDSVTKWQRRDDRANGR